MLLPKDRLQEGLISGKGPQAFLYDRSETITSMLENYGYYQKHDLFDFPHKMRNMRFMGHIIPPLTAIPAFRKRYQRNLNQTLVAPLIKAVDKN